MTLVEGGDRAGPVGAFGVGCAVTAAFMALFTAFSDPEETIDLVPGWISSAVLGFGVGLLAVAFYLGLRGEPWAWLALLPGVGRLLAALPLREELD